MRDITLEFKLLPRVTYALQQVWICGSAIVVAAVCVLELSRDVRRIAHHLPVSVPEAIVSLLLLIFVAIMAPAVFTSVRRYPVAFCVRLEIRGDALVLFARSGRRLRKIHNVIAEVRYRWKPKTVIFRAAPGSKDCFDIPLWLVRPSDRNELLSCIGWKADAD